jgi:hypothetical protein
MTLHIRLYAQLGKSSVGEQYGQENLEEIEEDQPDEAVDENVQVGSSFWVTEALGRNGVRARFGRAEMIKGCRREAGGPFSLQMPRRSYPTCFASRPLPSSTNPSQCNSHARGSQLAPLKFSTGGDYFNARSAGFQATKKCRNRIRNKNRTLQDCVRPPSLAIALHTTAATPTRANQTRGNKMAKKTLKKAKKIEATKPLVRIK